MKGAAEFCLGWLVEDGQGHLVAAPSFSPEQKFIAPDGRKASASMATTMDMAIIWDLFSNCIKRRKSPASSRILRTNSRLRARSFILRKSAPVPAPGMVQRF